MRILAIVLVSATLWAQVPVASCPADRPVDDFITELNRQKSKKANRNTNPLPSVGCIFGWCRDTGTTPPTIPNPPRAQSEDPNAHGSKTPQSTSGESSSKTENERCNERTEQALQAAHNVDVGDLQVEEKHYRAALSRYQEALEQKPGDAAIHVRLGRVLEKLNDVSTAKTEYEAAERIGTPEKWIAEARGALARLNAAKK